MSSFPYHGDDPYLYASYAREDRREVKPEMEHLHHLGYRVCFSDAEMEEAPLKGASFAVFFISPCAADSDEMKAELQAASQAGLDSIAIHLDEVELHGTVGLLLGGVDDVKKYRMKEAFYRRQLDTSIDGRIKREDATPPPIRDEPAAGAAAQAAPRRKKSSGPGLVETFKKMDKTQQAVYGGVGGLFLLILIGIAYLALSDSGTPDPVVPDGAGAGVVQPADGMTKEQREAQAKALQEDLEKRRKERERLRKAREIKTKAANAYTAALSKVRNGDAKGALADFDEAIKLAPKNTGYYMARGEARFKAKEDAGAIADFGKVIELEPNNAEAYMARAEAQKYSRERYDDAIADYTKVLELQKENVDALIGRADVKRKQEKFKEAIKDYTASLKIKKEYAAYYGRSLCWKKLGDQKRYRRDQELGRQLRQ